MPVTATAPPPRHKPKRVIYKSTALEHAAPHLVAAAPAELVSAARSIQNASAAAERVRSTYKQARDIELGTVVDGNDGASNAQKHERRLKMNRQSAAASRVRREAYTKALEAELVTMENRYRSAMVNLEAALERNRELEAVQNEGTPPLKQEPDVDAVELGKKGHVELNLDSFDDVLTVFPQKTVEEMDFGAASSKTEAVLADPSFIDNVDILESPVRTTLTEWFIVTPNEPDEFL